MKIIHCADLHLDSALSANFTNEKAKERKNELVMTFVRMVEYASANQVKAIIIAGDLFDKKVISARVRKTVYEVIVKYPEINFYYLQGNHDTSSFIDHLVEIPSNLFLFSSIWKTYELISIDDRAITISGVELDRDNSNVIYASLLLKPQDFNIVTLHGQIAQYHVKDKSEIIDLGSLRDKNISYLALGHIHEYREGQLPPGGIYCYPGCLEGRGYDEPGSHGFVLLDIDEKNMTMKKEFVPFASREIRLLDVDITGCETSMEIIEKIKENLGEQDLKKDLVKIILSGDVDVNCEKNLNLISQYFDGQFYCHKITDQTGIRIDFREFEKDKSLKGEFIRLVESYPDLAPDDRMAIIRCGLQVLRGEEIEV
ncbi:MAG: metallophosphoesterase [Lachnospiraceae bacterium]|nr:metallophosphoesterase [Lachnospiraceae bacterium]